MRHETLPYPSPHLSSDVRQASWTSTALLLPRPPRLRSLQRRPEAALPRWLVAVGAGYAHIPEPQSLQLAYRTRPCESKTAQQQHCSNSRHSAGRSTRRNQSHGKLATKNLSSGQRYHTQTTMNILTLPSGQASAYRYTQSSGVEHQHEPVPPRDGGAVI